MEVLSFLEKTFLENINYTRCLDWRDAVRVQIGDEEVILARDERTDFLFPKKADVKRHLEGLLEHGYSEAHQFCRSVAKGLSVPLSERGYYCAPEFTRMDPRVLVQKAETALKANGGAELVDDFMSLVAIAGWEVAGFDKEGYKRMRGRE